MSTPHKILIVYFSKGKATEYYKLEDKTEPEAAEKWVNKLVEIVDENKGELIRAIK
jgi:hypothetical protein